MVRVEAVRTGSMGESEDAPREEEEMLRHSPLRSTMVRGIAAQGSGIISSPPVFPSATCVVTAPARRVKTKTAFFTSEICERHDVPGHPECLQRTQVIRERLLKEFPQIEVVRNIERVTEDQLLLFHAKAHVDSTTALFRRVYEKYNRPTNNGKSMMVNIDDDTTIMEGTEEAAMIAAGAVCHAIDLVMSDSSECINAFCGVRPPGHHAEPHAAMGFCFFNNIGIGACHLLQRYPDEIRRLLILDFDVHHGNGTQAKFLSDSPQVCFVSTHQGQFYPFTGKADERGTHDNIINVPLAPSTTSQTYREHFLGKVLPVMHAFQPDFILISAGFDAHRLDPLADIDLESEDYYWITKHVTEIAWKYAQGRIVSSLEGGYNLKALADSAAAHVRALVEGSVAPKPRKDTNETGDATTSRDVDALTSAFAAAVSLDEPLKELRLTVHFDAKEKLLVLKDRSTKALMQSCKNKFPSLKKKAKTITIQDCHGTVVTDDTLRSLTSDLHLYLR